MRQLFIILTGVFISSLLSCNGENLEINPEDANVEDVEVYFNRGFSKNELGDYTGAIADYSKAIELNPEYVEAYFNRGFAKNGLGDYTGAIADYSKAIEFNPGNAMAYNNRGFAKIKLGEKYNGCLDLSKAGELGYVKAYDIIKEYCN